ncbi:hypothetical protein GALMADRAFT_139497 [Galerina marginata CBS 339.88]|uniref:Uncharacterized protein n=1 Tax=Galerina marginata (strain CBS 339.88) TaxID=685588 RepID=A0A067T2N3_GALM3|nr:hypothetical protein GALMADRAFT_139497 [Galerina marginata CBS 339.88]
MTRICTPHRDIFFDPCLSAPPLAERCGPILGEFERELMVELHEGRPSTTGVSVHKPHHPLASAARLSSPRAALTDDAMPDKEANTNVVTIIRDDVRVIGIPPTAHSPYPIHLPTSPSSWYTSPVGHDTW